MAKALTVSPVRSRSIEAREAMLRGGAGKHSDRRTKRQRTRQTALRAALRD